MVKYRCVTANGIDGEIIAIGYDENQGGKDYNGTGKWCNFAFDKIPLVPENIGNELEKEDKTINVLKIDDNKIKVKTLNEVRKDLKKSKTKEIIK